MTPEQRALLEDKAYLWWRYSKEGNMELRDYNRRAAKALDILLNERDDFLSILVSIDRHARPFNWEDEDQPGEAGEHAAAAWRRLDAALAAQGIEAATAGETREAGLDAKHESPVGEADAAEHSSEPKDKDQ